MDVDFLPFSALPEGERQGTPEWPAEVREAVGEKPPEGWVRMSAEDYAAYRAKHEAAQDAWTLAASLPALRAAALQRLADHRWQREMAGLQVNGVLFDTDREARGSLTAAVLLAQMAMQTGQPYQLAWKGPEGFVTLSGEQIISVGVQVAAYVAACFAREAELQIAIEAMTDPNEIQSIDFMQMWVAP